MNARTAIVTDQAPTPAHTFSQGVRKGGLLQVSGQGPVDPATNEYLYPGDVAMAGSFRLLLRKGPGGEPGPREDHAVEAFEAGLLAAKGSAA